MFTVSREILSAKRSSVKNYTSFTVSSFPDMISNVPFIINLLAYEILVLFKRCKIVFKTTDE